MTEKNFNDPTSSKTPEPAVQQQQFPSSLHRPSFSKPLLTQRALHKGAEIETPGGHWEIEWYENGKRQRRRAGPHPAAAVKALAKQKLRLQAMDAGIVLADAEPADGKRPLRQAVEEFLAEKKRTNAHKTWIALKQVLELFQRICPRRYLEDIKRADVMDKFVGALQEAGQRPHRLPQVRLPHYFLEGPRRTNRHAERCTALRAAG